MDLICCSCDEWKSVGSCNSINKIPTEKVVKFLIKTDLTQNSDGKFYVCETCKTSIDSIDRIGHLPRSRYFYVKGELIMISADLAESLQKILPLEQNLVPVSFKKKLEYTGHYI